MNSEHSSGGEHSVLRPPIPTVVQGDTLCVSCGYPLKGLDSDGVCPECGGRVARSLHGDLLAYASRGHVDRLVRGAMTIAAGTLLIPVGLVGFFLMRKDLLPLSERGAEVADASARGVASVLGLLGWWWLSSPDPDIVGPDQDQRFRRVLRILLVVNLALSLGEFLTSIAVFPIQGGERFRVHAGAVANLISSRSTVLASPAQTIMALTGVAILVLWAVQFIVEVLFIRSLARRASDRSLESFATVCVWLVLPAFTILTPLTCGVSALLGVLLYMVLIVRLCIALRRVRAGQAAAAGG